MPRADVYPGCVEASERQQGGGDQSDAREVDEKAVQRRTRGRVPQERDGDCYENNERA